MYEAFTGRLPFDMDTVGGMIHSRVALTPARPCTLCLEIPRWLDEIIMSLMNRNPEGRIPSAEALIEGLEAGMRTGESVDCLSIRPPMLHGEGVLCGREDEKRELVQWLKGIVEAGAVPFERPGVMVLSGASGCGKTVLAEWLCRYARQHYPEVIVATGKFDQSVERPGSAFVVALQQVVRTLLGEPENRLREWRKVVKRLMGDGAFVLSSMVPDFSLLLDTPPDDVPMELESSAKANVTHMAMVNFFRVFKQMGRPLILFIDDIQWADEDSRLFLNLLTGISGEKVGLLAAFRTSESQSALVDSFFQAGTMKKDGIVDVMPIQGLDSLAVETFLAMSLGEDRKKIAPLAELVYAKTGGIPYHVNAFLERILSGGELVRAHGPHGEGWHWNQQKLEALPMCTSAAHWVSERVDSLDMQMRRLVEAASLLGHKVVPELLAMVVQRSEEIVKKGLETLCEKKIFVRTREGYSFTHDLVQKAAYERMTQGQREMAHFSAGMHIYEGLKHRPGPYLFDVVYQFNASGSVPIRESYRKELVLLNLDAGKQAMETSSFGQALECFRCGLRFLGEEGWQREYVLCLEMTSAAAEAAYALGEYAVMEAFVVTVEKEARNDWDCVNVWRMRIRGAIAANDLTGALAFARESLGRFGFRLPVKVTRMHQLAGLLRIRSSFARLGRKGFEQVPVMTDAGHLSIMELFFSATMAAYLAGSDLSPLMIFTALRYSLKHGRSKYTPFLLAAYGFICLRVDSKMEKGTAHAYNALALLEKEQRSGVRGKTLSLTVCLVQHWKEPIQDLFPLYLRAYEQSLAEGDSEYAGGAVSAWFYTRFFGSDDLHQLARDMVTYGEEMERLRLPFTGTVRNLQQAVANLTDAHAQPVQFSGPFFTDDERPRGGDMPNDHTAALNYHITKGFLAFLFGDDDLALHHVGRYASMLDAFTSTYTIPVFSAFAAAVCARHGGKGLPLKQNGWLKQAREIEKTLGKAAVDAPCNFAHLHEMVRGELLLARKQVQKAVVCFEQAAEKAKKNNFTFHEAYASERAGFCYLKMGRKRLARVCLTDAVNLWRFWGAEAKARQLETDYEEVLWRLPSMGAAGTGDLVAGSHHGGASCCSGEGILDLEGLSGAFEALSTERNYDRLVEKLVHTALEYGGAEAGAVCRLDDGQVRLEAWKGVGTDKIELCGSSALSEETRLPVVMMHYVARTGTLLQYNHGEPPVVYDPYFDDFGCGSAICIPSMVQSRQCGILYLENRTLDHLFEGRRLSVLKTLSSQMAGAMENTRLYESLKDQAEKLQMVNRVLKNEVTDRRAKETALMEKERELKESGEKLSEANISLKQMLSKSDENMTEVRENMMRNVDDLILPYIDRLKGTQLTPVQGNLVEMLEKNIDDILSPFARNVNAGFFRLTPAEIQTAQLVRSGKTTKEIAELLNLSPRTIDAYRDSIREKLGLKKSGVNLRVYLMQM
ncbi:Predicted ATPase [Desulfoluna spongiiphila]|uniref:Predicted ATPase n=2 Tax=Desulfoluna spongiiphila TaxID=419481 RepID=A0A1G5HUS8_9BACT|nr:Predicted ATPase [Desulfoluna spongiiphila]